MKLWVKILLAVLLGIIAGAILGPTAHVLKPIGTIFLRSVQMVIVPLVISSMVAGITGIHDPKKLGRVGLTTVIIYLCSTIIAISIGIGMAQLMGPGRGMNLHTESTLIVQATPGIDDLIVGLFPSNPIEAMATGNILQIIVFAVFLGIAINFAGARARPVSEFMESLAEVMYRLTSLVMEFSPIGVFAIMASVTGEFGLGVLTQLFWFLAIYIMACALHFSVVFVGLIRAHGLKMGSFIKGMGDAMVMAFSTCSSSATLPVALHCLQANLGVSKNIASFVMPLGISINMNGAAIFQGMAAIFAAQAFGIDLSWGQLLTIVVTAVMSAIGAAGVPGSGFIMLSLVFNSAGLPLEALALLFGIDRIREMFSTVLNITGDAVCAVVVAKREGELDESQYYHHELVELEGSEV